MDYKVQRNVEEIHASIQRLNERIAKSVSSMEKGYRSFESRIKAMRSLSRVTGESELNTTADLFGEKIEDMAEDVRKASMVQLKVYKLRLANMKQMAGENLRGNQLEGVNKQIEFMMDKINEETFRRRATFARLNDFLRRNGIDAVSITAALTTRNPIIGLGVKYVLERMKAAREIDRQSKRGKLQDELDLKRKLERDAAIAARKERIDKARADKEEQRKKRAEDKEEKETEKARESVQKEREQKKAKEEKKAPQQKGKPEYKKPEDNIIDAEFWDITDEQPSAPPPPKQASKTPLLLGPASYDYNAIVQWAQKLDNPVSVSSLRKAFKLDEATATDVIRRLKQDGVQVFGKKANKVASDIPWPPPGYFQRAAAGSEMPDAARREFLKKMRGIGMPKMLPAAPPGSRPRDGKGRFLKVEKVSSPMPQPVMGESQALVPYRGGESGGLVINLLQDIKTGIYGVDKTMVKLHKEDQDESAAEEEARLEAIKASSATPKLLGPASTEKGLVKSSPGTGLVKQLAATAIGGKLANAKILNKIPGVGKILGSGAASAGTAAAGQAAGGAATGAAGAAGKMAGRAGSMLAGPVGMIGGGLLMMAIDGVLGWMKRSKWGVSGGSATLGGMLGGSMDRGVLNTFANMGKWALLGAGIGSVVPVVGTLAGGLIGAAIGGIFGMIGGENIANFMEKTGIGRFFASFFTMVGTALMKPFKMIWLGIKTMAVVLKGVWKTLNFIVDIVLIPLQKIWDSTVGPILDPLFKGMSQFFGWFSDIFDWVTNFLNSGSDFEKTIDQLLADDKVFDKMLGSFQRAFLDFAAALLEKVPSWIPGSGLLHDTAKEFRKKSSDIAKATQDTAKPPAPKNAEIVTGGNTVTAIPNHPPSAVSGVGEPTRIPGPTTGAISSPSAPRVSGASPVPQALGTPGQAVTPGNMRTSDSGLNMIKKHEGFAGKEYWDFKGYSIGYGHLQTPEERRKFGGKITEEQATELLRRDVAKSEAIINSRVKVPLNQDQFDSLVDFGHSGPAFLMKVIETLNSKPGGDFEGAAARMKLYVKAKRNDQYETLPGLVARREEETGRLLRGRPQQGAAITSLQRQNEDKKAEISAKQRHGSPTLVANNQTAVNQTAVIAPQSDPRNGDSTFRNVTRRNY